MSDAAFSELAKKFSDGGTNALLDTLAARFRAEKKHHQLFDVLLMRERARLGLPSVLSSSIDELPEPTRSQLEDAYIAVCREVGSLLLAEGKVREAWPYLRPVGDRSLVAQGLANVEPNEENLNPLIEILLHEGVDVGAGFQLVLDHYGTCNSISTFEGVVLAKPRVDQQAAAERLVRRLHEELLTSLRTHIERQEGKVPTEQPIVQLLADRDWMFEGNNYHIDTTHLASIVRFARVLESPESVRLAYELAEYGRRLSPQFHFAAEEPFAELYVSHVLFFAAQLGDRVDEAVQYFRERAEKIDPLAEGTAAAETYISLLARLRRFPEAIEAAATLIPPGTQTSGFAPTMMELSRENGDYSRLLQVCQERDDVVGYAAGLIEQSKR
jgi:hypothetical protein